jgi:single-strand DNA-binding protein
MVTNNVNLLGNTGKEVEFKTLEFGKQVANFTLAVNETYTNNKGEKVTNTDWFSCSAWGKNAENISNIVSKGDRVLVTGKLTTRVRDIDGTKVTITEVLVDEFLKLTPKSES